MGITRNNDNRLVCIKRRRIKMTEAQVKLFQMYMRENQKLGVQLDIALEALSKCADNKLLSAIVNKALVEIIKIGEITKGGDK